MTRGAATPVALLAALLGGCQALEPFRLDTGDAGIEVPGAWSTASPPARVDSAWLRTLDDGALGALVAEAVDHNPDLRAAAARRAAAIAETAIEAAGALPTVDAGSGAARRGSATTPTRRSTQNSFNLQFDVAWEPDVWGRIASATEASRLRAAAFDADYEAARLSLAANVARAWFDAIEANLQAALARDTVRNFESNLGIVEEGFRAGLNGALDVRLERANLASARGQMESRMIALERASRALEVLLGRYPSGAIALPSELNPVRAGVPAGVPSDLLARRPDVGAAALRLESSARRVDEARRARLPSLRLTGSGGLSSGELRHVLDFDSILWSVAAGLTAPILDGGRIEARVDLAKARADEALSGFASTLLTAFREVESSLAAEAHLARQEAALREAVDESEQAEALALERYRAGLVDIITWLEARRRAFNSRSSLISVENQRLQNRITLHLALGGSFGAAGAASPGIPKSQ